MCTVGFTMCSVSHTPFIGGVSDFFYFKISYMVNEGVEVSHIEITFIL